MGVNSLPKTVTQQRRGCDLNPGPTAPKSSTLITRLPTCTYYFSLIVRQNMSAVSTASDCIVRTVDASVILMLASAVVVDCEWKFRQMWSQWLLLFSCSRFCGFLLRKIASIFLLTTLRRR